MFKRAVNFIRTAPRYLRLAELALVLGFLILGADALLNNRKAVTNVLLSKPDRVHTWTFSGPGGWYGLVDYFESDSGLHTTNILLGPRRYYIQFSIYAVVGAGNCFLFAGVFLVAGLVRRKRK